MKFAHSIKQKTKVAFLLFFIMVCIIFIRILEDRSIKNMEKSFVSLYNDRLIPATDLFFLLENFTEKKELLDHHISEQSSTDSTKSIAKKQNADIDSLLIKYENTYLVSDEKGYLQALKSAIDENRKLEKDVLNANKYLAASHTSSLNKSFKKIFTSLSNLTKVQSKTGKELVKDSKKIVSGSNLYSTIQFVLAITIGILIMSILFASNVVKVKQEKFNLN